MAENDCSGKHTIEPVCYFEKDSDRTAFGWGWEVSRRGEPMDSNPFEFGTWRYSDWRDGWVGYKTSQAKKASKDAK